MTKKIYTIIFFVGVFVAAAFIASHLKENNHIRQLREKHAEFLENSPFKETLSLSKEERKAMGIPPNKYFERQWELTMNPALGYPEPHKVHKLQQSLKNPKSNLAYRVPGDGIDNQWTERGPNNVGGRTRVAFFDPNDITNSRVFAGAVSGGLWVTEDITTNGGWTQVSGIPGNLNVSCFAIDPNDSDTWYIGTGEQYTFGQAVGNGLYRTTDGGITWANVPIQLAGGGSFEYDNSDTFFAGVYYINDVIAWNNAGVTELFIGVGAHIYADAAGPANWLGLQSSGLYRSTDNGTNWSRIESANMEFNYDGGIYYYIPNDFEVSADNTLWMATVNTPGIGGSSGQIYSSSDGATWTEEYQVPNGRRVEIETSATDPGKIYVLSQISPGPPVMLLTTDAFASGPASITTPNDPDTSVPFNDFTRNQSFYDLVIETDPSDDNIVYIGGINIHRSADSGASWNTISHWASFYSEAGSLVHADQHALSFRPGNSNQAVIGHDGGVSFASDLSAAGDNLTTTYPVDNDYNVTQFYYMAVAPLGFADSFLAGAQDNGTQYFYDAEPAGPDNAIDITGGDGGYCFYDQVATEYLVTNYIYNNYVLLYDFNVEEWRTIASNSDNDGDFINPQALDSNVDMLYSNGSNGGTYQLFRYEDLTSIPNGGEATRTVLTNPLIDASITALTVSPYNVMHTNLLMGLENGNLIRLLNADFGLMAWHDITGPLFVGSISDVEFGQTENDIFVTFHNYGVTSIWYSNDGGTSWQDKEGNLPDMPVKAILQNPLNPEEVIVGTELGIWRTSNFSAAAPTWVQSYNGMSDVKVTDLQLRDDNMVFASTFGRGIFSGPFTAAPLSTDINDLMAREINIYPNPSDGEINIRSTVDLGETRLDIFNLKGQKVYTTKELISTAATNTLQLRSLSSGTYLLRFNNGEYRFTKKVLIK